LTARPKQLPPKYFYDEIGAQLFEDITASPEYYLTRCELQILGERAPEIARFFPADSALIEFGSGSSKKVRILLGARRRSRRMCRSTFLPRCWSRRRRICAATIRACGAAGRSRFHATVLIAGGGASMAHVGFFPGSTIGNFEPHEACSFLRHAGRMLDAAQP
jgi:Uncharacterized conserved protein